MVYSFVIPKMIVSMPAFNVVRQLAPWRDFNDPFAALCKMPAVSTTPSEKLLFPQL